MTFKSPPLQSVLEVLGLPTTKNGKPVSGLEMVEMIRAGLPVESLSRLANTIAPGDPVFRDMMVPHAHQIQRLRPMDGDRVVRIARLWIACINRFGAEHFARSWLFKKHPDMALRRPIDLALMSGMGTLVVFDMLDTVASPSAITTIAGPGNGEAEGRNATS